MVGMAANPHGAHQVGRVFADRVTTLVVAIFAGVPKDRSNAGNDDATPLHRDVRFRRVVRQVLHDDLIGRRERDIQVLVVFRFKRLRRKSF